MATPTIAWNEALPADNSYFMLGDDRIREAKLQLREIIGTDHYMPTSTGQSDDWGRHEKVTFIQQEGAPTAVATAYIFYTKEDDGKCELFALTPDDDEVQLTSKGSWVGGMVGEIKMWAGTLANIPISWHLCDGTGSYPDLLASFIMGISSAVTEPGTTGGDDSFALLEVNLPSHTHTGTTSSDGAHTHTSYLQTSNGSTTTRASSAASRYGIASFQASLVAGGSHTHPNANSGATGGATEIDNRPAYFELAFICKE